MQRGPFYMVLATLAFTVMVACVKVARAELEAHEVMVWRSLVSIPVAWWYARGRPFRLANPRLFALRAALGMAAMLCVFSAARGLPVADLTLIWRLQPVFVAMIAPLALGASERSGRLVVVSLVAGIAGCAILLGPQLSLGSTWGLVALAGAGLSGAAHVCIRRLGRDDDPAVLVFWFQVVILVGSMTMSVPTAGTPLPTASASLWPALVGSGLAAAAGQLLMTRAYSLERASTVAAAGAIGPVWGVLADIFAFGVVPGWEVIVGGAVIVGASLLVVLFKPSAPSDRAAEHAGGVDTPG